MSSKSELTAQEIMDALNDRRGYDNIWDDLDEDLRKEIVESIAEIIEENYETT